ncbi:amino acid adenylation domain-containing protein [Hymenobacter aquaticus]|uniref:Amino acid adenylation domain-containing protein n=1 Tax=Hymenobacter aquaticus TaxID=1867101 RepID=A0A4Z0PUT2_9BACT|nr:non-ribosomal peptide synthetase [Hymenobacter aquaticus]TGE21487.1 amino acid adenylation domain-containing protein [Hymenobacter aquaticus]
MNNLIERLRKNKVTLMLVEDNLQVNFADGPPDPALLQELRDHKAQLVEFLRGAGKQRDFDSIPVVEPQASYPATPGQYRLWVVSQLPSASVAYNVPSLLDLDLEIDVECFTQALHQLVERHEILRTAFREDALTQEVHQHVLPAAALPSYFQYLDLREDADKVHKANQYVRQDSLAPFDLSAGPLLRVALLQLEDHHTVLFYNLHHIICDGWSLKVFRAELLALYQAQLQGRPTTLKPLRIQYKDFSGWQRKLLAEEQADHRQYWLDKFAGPLPVLELPTPKMRPPVKTYGGAELRFQFDAQLLNGLKQFSQDQGGTLYMALVAVVKGLFYRFSGQEDIVLGTPTAGRDHIDLESQIGLYINTLALRTQFSGQASFLALFQQVKDTILGAFAHQFYSFDHLTQELNLKSDPGRSPLFDVMVILHNNDLKGGAKPSGPAAPAKEGVAVPITIAQFDLRLSFKETADGLTLGIQYNTDIYTKAFVERLGQHVAHYAQAVLLNPQVPLTAVPYLSAGETQQLLGVFTDTGVHRNTGKTLVDLFEAQARNTPAAPALVYGLKRFSYQELDALANQFAHFLHQQHHIEPNKLVGLQLHRSEWLVVAILGVLKAGGAYVPISPSMPQERVDYIVADSQCALIVDDTVLAEFFRVQATYDARNRADSAAQPTDLAYVIYTSGSTGNPKGVMIEHRSVVSFFENIPLALGLRDVQALAATTEFTFDISVLEILGTLCSGKRLVLFDDATLADPAVLYEALAASEADGLQLTPSRLRQLLAVQDQVPANIKVLLVGAEPLTQKLYDKLRHSAVQAINVYGPTETTIWSTSLTLDHSEQLTIGGPLMGEKIYILDDSLALTPIGIPGEICIGGSGIARGYLNRPELTAEKFIANPFVAEERIYRTGDLGKWLPDGTIEFIGRKDYQVKVRGYRIELGEIEAALLKNPAISAATTTVTENEDGEKDIVAYVVSSEPQTAASLRSFLKEKLPVYMVPSYFVQLEALPLNTSGKVDKKALPAVGGASLPSEVEYVAPRTELERVLARAWEAVLLKENASVKENFFDAGGNSIKSIRLLSRLKADGYDLSVTDILTHQVLEDLAPHLRPVSRLTDQGLVQGEVPLTAIQTWFLEKGDDHKEHFNQAALLFSKERMDKEGLQKCLERLVVHHDALRTTFRQEPDGRWIQETKVLCEGFTFEEFDLREAPSPWDQMAEEGERLQMGMNLADGPLVKVGLFRLPDGDRLLIAIHHLVVDGLSYRILFEDLSALYLQYQQGEEFALPAKTDSYKYFAEWERQYAQSELVKQEMAHWNALLEEEFPPLPIDHPEGSNRLKDTASLSFQLGQPQTEALYQGARRALVAVDDVLLTALAYSFEEVFGTNKLLLSMEGNARIQNPAELDVARTVGWFTTMYPVCLRLQEQRDELEQILATKRAFAEVPNNGVGFGLLRYVSDGELYQKAASNCTPQVKYNYFGDFGSGAETASGNRVFEFSGERKGTAMSPDFQRISLIDLSGIVVNKEVKLSITYSKFQYEEATIAHLVQVFKRELLRLIDKLTASQKHAPAKAEVPAALTATEASPVFPLTFHQQLFLSAKQQGELLTSTGSVGPLVLNDFDPAAFEAAYRQLLASFDVLRINIVPTEDGSLGQRVLPLAALTPVIDYHEIQSAEEIGPAQQAVGEAFQVPFATTANQLLRCAVIHGKGRAMVYLCIHHVITDAYSNDVILSSLGKLYESRGAAAEQLAQFPSYLDYARWQQNFLASEPARQQLAYWRQHLPQHVPALAAAEAKVGFMEEAGFISETELQQIQAFCKAHNGFLSTFLLTAYHLSFYHQTRSAASIINMVSSGRDRSVPGVDIDRLVGALMDGFPVSVTMHDDMTLAELFTRVTEAFMGGRLHQDIPLNRISQETEQRYGYRLDDAAVGAINYQDKAGKVLELKAGEELGRIVTQHSSHGEIKNDSRLTVVRYQNAIKLGLKYRTAAVGGSTEGGQLKQLLQLVQLLREQPHATLTTLAGGLYELA